MRPATIVEHNEISQPITEWALDYGLTPGIIMARLERGMPIAEAIETPMRVGHIGQRLPVYSIKQFSQKAGKRKVSASTRNDRTYTFRGETLTIREWSEIIGVNASTVAYRIRRGWSMERALSASLFRRGSMAGVAPNFEPHEGTGAGSTAQNIPNITFSQEPAE